MTRRTTHPVIEALLRNLIALAAALALASTVAAHAAAGTKKPAKGAARAATAADITPASDAALAAAAAKYVPGPGTDWIPLDDPKLLHVLSLINAVGPYEVPDLGVKKETNYARTTADLEPFSGRPVWKENFLEQMEYTGPGRAIPEPEHVDTVKIGFIGPIMATVSAATGGRSHEEALGIPMLQGARLAVEEWNARGGYTKRGIPFELDIANDNGLWGSSGNEITKMAYTDDVWGILGTIDGANSHIAIRVALKAEVVMINSGDTDPTFIETNIPWTLRVIGDDRQQAYMLIDYMYRKMHHDKVGIIRASNRYGRFGVREIRDGARRLGHPVPIEMAYRVGQDDFALELGRLKEAGVDAVVHWGDAHECALILNQMRAMGMTQPYFGCDRCASDEFVSLAGANADGAMFAYPWNPDRRDVKLERFRQAYRARFGMEPETYAAHAYDGMNMLIWAIQAAGLNRAKIRDVLAYLPHPWPGVTGDIILSAALDDVADTFLARRENGRWHYLSRADLGIPKGYIPPQDRLNRDFAESNPTVK
jgi:branched-chain amino acid transport system substrate-binding protein